jgi:hypothetical protein
MTPLDRAVNYPGTLVDSWQLSDRRITLIQVSKPPGAVQQSGSDRRHSATREGER